MDVMFRNGAQVIHRSHEIVPYGRAGISGPFQRSNIKIGKSAPELTKIFSEGRIDPNSIYRSSDGEEIKIPVRTGSNGSTKHFEIHLKPISENLAHIRIRDLTYRRSRVILDDTFISHELDKARVESEDNDFVSHLRREIHALAKLHNSVSQTGTNSHEPNNRISAQSLAQYKT